MENNSEIKIGGTISSLVDSVYKTVFSVRYFLLCGLLAMCLAFIGEVIK